MSLITIFAAVKHDDDDSNSSKSDLKAGEKFKLEPSRQRTGGKKKAWSCNI